MLMAVALAAAFVPARADEARPIETGSTHAFIRHVTRLAFYADAAPRCGLRSTRWADDLLIAIRAIIERTRDGHPAHRPADRDVSIAILDLVSAHDAAATAIRVNPNVMCSHASMSDGIRDADGLVRRHRDGRL